VKTSRFFLSFFVVDGVGLEADGSRPPWPSYGMRQLLDDGRGSRFTWKRVEQGSYRLHSPSSVPPASPYSFSVRIPDSSRISFSINSAVHSEYGGPVHAIIIRETMQEASLTHIQFHN